MTVLQEHSSPAQLPAEPIGKAALIASVGGQRGYADWTEPDHRARRLLAEFLGMAGLTFVLSGGAAVLARYGGRGLRPAWLLTLAITSSHGKIPSSDGMQATMSS